MTLQLRKILYSPAGATSITLLLPARECMPYRSGTAGSHDPINQLFWHLLPGCRKTILVDKLVGGEGNDFNFCHHHIRKWFVVHISLDPAD